MANPFLLPIVSRKYSTNLTSTVGKTAREPMNAYSQSPFSNLTPVVKNLLIINIIFYIATFVLPSAGINLVNLFSVYSFDSPAFRPWQIVTYMFMHSPTSFFHILFNMFALFSFGPHLENVMG